MRTLLLSPRVPGGAALEGGEYWPARKTPALRATGMPTGSQRRPGNGYSTSPSFPARFARLRAMAWSAPLREARRPQSWQKQLQRPQRICGHRPWKPQAPGHLWLSSQKRYLVLICWSPPHGEHSASVPTVVPPHPETYKSLHL